MTEDHVQADSYQAGAPRFVSFITRVLDAFVRESIGVTFGKRRANQTDWLASQKKVKKAAIFEVFSKDVVIN